MASWQIIGHRKDRGRVKNQSISVGSEVRINDPNDAVDTLAERRKTRGTTLFVIAPAYLRGKYGPGTARTAWLDFIRSADFIGFYSLSRVYVRDTCIGTACHWQDRKSSDQSRGRRNEWWTFGFLSNRRRDDRGQKNKVPASEMAKRANSMHAPRSYREITRDQIVAAEKF